MVSPGGRLPTVDHERAPACPLNLRRVRYALRCRGDLRRDDKRVHGNRQRLVADLEPRVLDLHGEDRPARLADCGGAANRFPKSRQSRRQRPTHDLERVGAVPPVAASVVENPTPSMRGTAPGSSGRPQAPTRRTAPPSTKPTGSIRRRPRPGPGVAGGQRGLQPSHPQTGWPPEGPAGFHRSIPARPGSRVGSAAADDRDAAILEQRGRMPEPGRQQRPADCKGAGGGVVDLGFRDEKPLHAGSTCEQHPSVLQEGGRVLGSLPQHRCGRCRERITQDVVDLRGRARSGLGIASSESTVPFSRSVAVCDAARRPSASPRPRSGTL